MEYNFLCIYLIFSNFLNKVLLFSVYKFYIPFVKLIHKYFILFENL